MKNIINIENVDFKKEPIFFGKPLNVQRYDDPKYPVFFEFFKKQLGFFWRPEEVNVGGKDRNDFNDLSDNEKFIFSSNLSYQILLDSVQSRGISHLLEDISSPEVEAFAKSWEFFETLHSYSYTYVIKNVYPEPSKIFDNILTNQEILKRTSSVTKYYDELINSLSDEDEYLKKKKLYLTLMSINILEGIRFYVSFACSFAFAENKKMEGNAKIISLISRDENLHLGFTQYILNLFRKDASEGFQEIVKDCEDIVINMFRDAAKEEMDWADYLFKDGSMLGLNSEILKKYMMWLTNRRMKDIGLEPIFEKVQNPITWINNWISSKGVQSAPQETEIDSYVVGSFKQDLDNADFSDFDDL
jgi:ribonucleoside-diphosphate reductase beta chain